MKITFPNSRFCVFALSSEEIMIFGGDYPGKDFILKLGKSGGGYKYVTRKSLIKFDPYDHFNSLKMKGNIVYASSLFDSCKKCDIAVKDSSWKSFCNLHKI